MNIELNHFYNCDCMELMKELPDNYIDLAIIDPPYGIGVDGQKLCIRNNPKHNRKEHKRKNWDNAIPSKQYFKELKRVSKNQIIWGGNYFVKYLDEGHKGWLVWDKGQRGLTMSDCELAYSSFDVPTRIVTINRCELRNDGTFHPTQKPVALYEWILNRYAKEGDIILDTHCGSASSLVACHRLGFDYIGCELDELYYKLANERLETEMAQMKLF